MATASVPLSELPPSARVLAVAARAVLLLNCFGFLGYGVFALGYGLVRSDFSLGSILFAAIAPVISSALVYCLAGIFADRIPSRLRLPFALSCGFLLPMAKMESFFPGATMAVLLIVFGAVIASLFLNALAGTLAEKAGVVFAEVER